MRIDEKKKLVWVNDDWRPSYLRNGKCANTTRERETARTKGAVWVTVAIRKSYGEYPEAVRVSAWGADDMGVEKWFEGKTHEDNVAMFQHWCDMYITNIPECVNYRWFIDDGFKNS